MMTEPDVSQPNTSDPALPTHANIQQDTTPEEAERQPDLEQGTLLHHAEGDMRTEPDVSQPKTTDPALPTHANIQQDTTPEEAERQPDLEQGTLLHHAEGGMRMEPDVSQPNTTDPALPTHANIQQDTTPEEAERQSDLEQGTLLHHAEGDMRTEPDVSQPNTTNPALPTPANIQQDTTPEEGDTTPETDWIINANEVPKRGVLKPLKKPIKTVWRMSMLAKAKRFRSKKEKLEMKTITEDSKPQCEAGIQQETAKTARQAPSQTLEQQLRYLDQYTNYFRSEEEKIPTP
ncbi:hypothetical protein HID58_005252 [Brassica napus]|uniref:Uncharacterized protein n=1 Tax=Brassica napus TaxID=3708 RepID=A0ABQ8EAX9_BRANA|nr:hypothetical protein HID58_005252 [Brassica napus]